MADVAYLLTETVLTENDRMVRVRREGDRFWTRDLLWTGLKFDYHGETYQVTQVIFGREGLYRSTARKIRDNAR